MPLYGWNIAIVAIHTNQSTYFNGLKFNKGPYVKRNENVFGFFLNLDLIEHKLCINNQMRNTDSIVPL
jgi:hypothetical protein